MEMNETMKLLAASGHIPQNISIESNGIRDLFIVDMDKIDGEYCENSVISG